MGCVVRERFCVMIQADCHVCPTFCSSPRHHHRLPFLSSHPHHLCFPSSHPLPFSGSLLSVLSLFLLLLLPSNLSFPYPSSLPVLLSPSHIKPRNREPEEIAGGTAGCRVCFLPLFGGINLVLPPFDHHDIQTTSSLIAARVQRRRRGYW